MRIRNDSLFFALLAGLLLLGSCRTMRFADTDAEPVDHSAWDALLKQHVSPEGHVDYEGFRADSLALRGYLDQLRQHPPNKQKWARAERMAYWINAYNAFTIDIVARNYPVESIRDIGPKVTVPFVNTVWDIKFIEISGMPLDLNNIEHRMLRKQFDDPRIHFAIVCASASCPILLNEAYVGERLSTQLDRQARAFLADEFRNEVSPTRLRLSKIFSWYKGDFTKEGDLISYLQPFTDITIARDAEIDFKDYDWRLNKKP